MTVGGMLCKEVMVLKNDLGVGLVMLSCGWVGVDLMVLCGLSRVARRGDAGTQGRRDAGRSVSLRRWR